MVGLPLDARMAYRLLGTALRYPPGEGGGLDSKGLLGCTVSALHS